MLSAPFGWVVGHGRLHEQTSVRNERGSHGATADAVYTRAMVRGVLAVSGLSIVLAGTMTGSQIRAVALHARSVGTTGLIGRVAVYNPALGAGEMRRLASIGFAGRGERRRAALIRTPE
jgi:hypothetical protein